MCKSQNNVPRMSKREGYLSSLFILGTLKWVLHIKPIVFNDFSGARGGFYIKHVKIIKNH